MVARNKGNPALTGIEVRHKKPCRIHSEGDCSCRPSYRAQVHNPQTGRPKKSPTFRTVAEAKAWKATAELAIRSGAFASGGSLTLQEAAEDWLAKAEAGQVLNRSGKPFKPSVLRSYETSLRIYVLPRLGSMKLVNVRRRDVQDLVDQIGLARAPSTVRNAVMPLRDIYRRALQRDLVQASPVDGVAVPSVESSRDRVATPEEASRLIEALPPRDRAVWATALYAGLRLGELQALRWPKIDLDKRVVLVDSSWDKKAGPVEPKSRAGRRAVPIPKALAEHLLAHEPRTTDRAGLAFGRSTTDAFSDSALRHRARREWANAGLQPIGFHEARHTYASLMIAAGINAKALAIYMGHRSITTTLDLYGHLFPGSEQEAADLLDAYLASG